ncbi:hypothetical protein H9P43_007300 [Blastocladiella emersonii ATCC 22665]|nr:hypothetical protein H9P43_007300 [Blastocladiella emersonii ATCC 22665]
MRSTLSAILATLAVVSLANLAAAAEAGTKSWTYEGANGPLRWDSLNPAYEKCGKGKLQSPVSFNATADLRTSGFPTLSLPPVSQFNLTNLGHTILFAPADDRTAMRTLAIGANTYNLKQFHIHTPSEHHLGKQYYDAEMHFVHATPDGKLAVVGVFVEASDRVDRRWSRVLETIPDEDETAMIRAFLDTSEIVSLTQRGYYSYTGSLTTPPCTEGVSWFVAATPLRMSDRQIRRIKSVIGNSARPTMYNEDLEARRVNGTSSAAAKSLKDGDVAAMSVETSGSGALRPAAGVVALAAVAAMLA